MPDKMQITTDIIVKPLATPNFVSLHNALSDALWARHAWHHLHDAFSHNLIGLNL